MVRSFVRMMLITTPMMMAGQAYAQNSASADADADVLIIEPLTLTNEAGLNFGRIAKGASSGTMVIGVSSDTVDDSGAGGATAAPGTGADAASRARFLVGGQESAGFSITVPASVVLEPTDTESGATDITVALTGSAATGSITDGEYEFFVGGSLPISAATVAGAYHGSFEVSVEYN